MTERHKVVLVNVLPDCDICRHFGRQKVAKASYDGTNRLFGTSWANMCREHFREFGNGLGLGVGQELRLRKESE